jgi:hypothetical protein
VNTNGNGDIYRVIDTSGIYTEAWELYDFFPTQKGPNSHSLLSKVISEKRFIFF